MNQTLNYPATTERTPSPSTPAMTWAWWAVASRFFVHGLVISTWVSRIPAIKTALHLNDGVFGFTLLGSAIGSVLGIPACGWIVSRYGSRSVSIWTSVGLCLALIPLVLAFNAPTLFAALFFFGAMAGSNDVAMNAQGVVVERLTGNPTMSRFHGMFSLAGILGAAAGGLIAAQGVPAREHFLIATAAFLIFAFVTSSRLIESGSQNNANRPHRLKLSQLPKPLIALSAIGFCIFLSEGAIADWTAIYLRQVLLAGPGLAAAGYAVFSAAMAIFRLIGDAITVRLGAERTIRIGAILAASGLASALLVQSPYWALPGFALAGVGYSSIIPLVFAAGGRIRGVSEGAGVATVSGLGYLGFLIGPPAIGFLSEATNLRVGLALIVMLSALAAMLVNAAAGKETNVVTGPERHRPLQH